MTCTECSRVPMNRKTHAEKKNRITNGYKYGTHDRYQDGRPIFIFTWASAETETQTEYIRMYKNGISYTKHINRRGNRNCTEDVNRCMIRKSYVVYINRFIATCVLNFTFEYRYLCSHLSSYILSLLPKVLINILRILTCVASINHIKYLPDSTN